MNSKLFFWTDKSGRGETAQITIEQMSDMPDEKDWKGIRLSLFVYDADIGDIWEDNRSRFIRVQ